MTRLSVWWRRWKPWTRDFDGRAFWIGVGSIMDLSGQQPRRNLEQLHVDQKAHLKRKGARREEARRADPREGWEHIAHLMDNLAADKTLDNDAKTAARRFAAQCREQSGPRP